MAEDDLLLGLLVGLQIHLPPPNGPFRLVVGASVLIVAVIIGILLCKDLGQTQISDTSKALWTTIFIVLPLFSWIAYYFVIKKGKITQKSLK